MAADVVDSLREGSGLRFRALDVCRGATPIISKEFTMNVLSTVKVIAGASALAAMVMSMSSVPAQAAPAGSAPPSAAELRNTDCPVSNPLITYRVHVQDYGWLGQSCDGYVAGTTGESRRIEKLEVHANIGYLCLKGHIQDQGDDPSWSCQNGSTPAVTGTEGLGRRLEGVHIYILDSPPICAEAHVEGDGWQEARCGTDLWVGTSGQGKRMEAIKIWKQ
ncbi:hypothetical protein [Nocardia sp. NPDC050175]|uniref:hypothetical protein n=1 Tax=Nocardia sp. NPDC050175 TaxID=3364317 RepID=UPI00379464AD